MTREEREKREHRERLRATFDQAAGLYGRARPGYPPALFDDLADLTGIRPGSRVLEIGPGTGQATLPLAERGGRVVAVELGPDLAARVGGRCPQLQRGARPVRPVRSRDVPGTGRLGLGCRR
jgi:protein-L-isoaspartate O-methyltransferase